MVSEDIFDGHGKGRPPLHPFASMELGQVVEVLEDAERLQPYVHVYGRSSGKKFKTRTIDGVLYVKRVS